MVGDLIVSVKNELTSAQLSRVVEKYATLMHNPYMTVHGQMACVRMVCQTLDAIILKDTPDGAAALMNVMIYALAEKMSAIVSMAEDVMERLEKQKEGETSIDTSTIEKERPVANSSYATEAPEDVMRGKI